MINGSELFQCRTRQFTGAIRCAPVIRSGASRFNAARGNFLVQFSRQQEWAQQLCFNAARGNLLVQCFKRKFPYKVE